MKTPFRTGDQKIFRHTVVEEDKPAFNGEPALHPVYSTYALARDAEWAGRLFVLEMKEEDEEGIGTAINIRHYAPAFVGEEVLIISTLFQVLKNEIVTTFEATVGEQMIANGETRQKIVKKEKLSALFNSSGT